MTDRSGKEWNYHPEKLTQVPKTQKDIVEYIKFRTKKMRLSRIIETKIENETRILLKKQKKKAWKVKDKAGIDLDVKQFMFRQP